MVINRDLLVVAGLVPCWVRRQTTSCLRKRNTGQKDHYLSFLRELVVCLLTQHGTKPSKARRSLAIPIQLRDNIRYPNYHISYLSN